MNTYAPAQKRQHEETAPHNTEPGKTVRAISVGLPLFMQTKPAGDGGVTQRQWAGASTPSANDEYATGYSSQTPRIQRHPEQATGETRTATASVDRVLASAGKPLDSTLQQDMGQRFGHDFSNVRVHTDAEAAASARAVNALAYTVGNRVVFGQGSADTSSTDGRHRLAHELVHVLQQAKHPVDPRTTEPADSHAEREAHDIASRVVRGERAPSPRAVPTGITRDVGWARRGPIPDPYGMGYNTILTAAGAAAEPAVRDLARCEGKGMTLDRARFEALSAARRRAVIDLQPHAIGTACETWFPQLRASHLAGTMEGMQGTLYWSGTSQPNPGDNYRIRETSRRPSGTAPISAGATENTTNAFAVWMNGGAPPSSSSAVMNCWEAIMFAAWTAGLVSESRLRQIHTDAAAAGKAASSAGPYYAHLYTALGGPGSVLGSTTDPARGDLVFFDFPDHVVLATGTRNTAGEREVMSLWVFPPDATATNFVSTIQRTTIEALVRSITTYLKKTPTVRHASNPF